LTDIVDVDHPDCFSYYRFGQQAILAWADRSKERQLPSLGILGSPLKLTPYIAAATVTGESLAIGAHLALSARGASILSVVLAVRKDTCMVFWAGRAAQTSRESRSNQKPYIDYLLMPNLAKQESRH
jgi:hypothetical protein